MLAPDERTLLYDALRPPEGFDLDRAVATTFSLDLDALLVAPLAFALFDWVAGEDGSPNPLALMESLRRYADRTTVFCQAGEIGFREAYRPLVVLVEDSIVPVVPPESDAIFHPKVWALRFVDDSGDVRYRLLVASRNLTFDSSWDTLLRLDGTLTPDPVASSRPIAEFVRRLPDLAAGPIADGRASAVRALADELDRVEFDIPDGFESMAFHPIGLGQGWPLRSVYDRALVVSPFLAPVALERISSVGQGHVLVSSPEALDDTGRGALAGFESTFVLTAAAMASESADSAADAEDADERSVARPELDGLHAKLYLLEHGDDVHLYTGSANATEAAFGGNVELLVELTGPRRVHGIDALLVPGESEPSFRTLLEEYRPSDDEPADETDEEAARRLLDRLQRRIAQLAFTLRLVPDADDFQATVLAKGALPDEIGRVVDLTVWPISLGGGHAVDLRREGTGLQAAVGRLSADAITAFLAVRATLRQGTGQVDTTFVVTAALEGAPEGRSERVLVSMLRGRDDLLRYLLFLLADIDTDLEVLLEAFGAPSATGNARREIVSPPLFESMLKALVRDPTRLDHVASLVADLRRDDAGRELLPGEFDAVWAPIWEVRQELAP